MKMKFGKIKKLIYEIYLWFKDKVICIMKKPPFVLDTDETIDEIVNNKFSVSRFGDGEFSLLTQSDEFSFQNKNNELSNRLKEILVSNDDNILIGIPNVFTDKALEIRTNESKKWWKRYMMYNRSHWYKYLNFNKTYCNANFTRNYIAIKDKESCKGYFQNVKRIWDKRDVILVEGEFTRFGIGNDILDNANKVERILAPNENAFDRYDEIMKEVIKCTKDKLILVALGPTATVLAYDLNKYGFQSIDIGHLDIEYEWFLQKTNVKTKVDNKYTFEAGNIIKEEDNLKDIKYKKQIIAKID